MNPLQEGSDLYQIGMKSASFLHFVLVALLSVGLGFASIFAFPQAQTPLEEGWEYEGNFLWNEALSSSEILTARRNGRDSLSIFTQAETVSTWDEENSKLETQLHQGSVFFSTLADDFSVSISTPFVRIDSQNSMAYVTFDQATDQLEVFALNHPSEVTFLADEKNLNVLLVPTGYKMKIPASKVNEILARLRLTKLSKEFQVFAFEEIELPSELREIMSKSAQAYESSTLAFLNQIQENSDFGPRLTGFGGVLNKASHFFENLLTVLPLAEQNLAEREKNNALQYALTNLLYGDFALGQTWVSTWQNASQDPEELAELYRALFNVLPGDALYPLKAASAEILYPEQDPLRSLRRQFQEIESLLSAGFQVEAVSAYRDYQERFETALHFGDFEDSEMLGDLSREYILVELLLRGSSIFYSTDFVSLLSELEETILSLAGSDQDLDEERQAFVQSKIRFLENLFDYVIERKVSLSDATELANELLLEAQSYLSSIQSQVAVQAYFESKLEEFEYSIAFMNSPEFYSYESFEEGLADYKAKEADLEDLNEYLQSLRVGEEESSSLSLEEASLEVEDILHLNGIQFSQLRSLGDNAYRLFEIVGARTSGIAFEANYDRETHILYDVVVGEQRFSTGLTLEAAQEVIEETVNEEAEGAEEASSYETEQESQLSSAEEVAISRVELALEEAHLEPNDFEITIVDLDENLFVLEGSFRQGKLRFSGNFDLDTNLVSEIVWEYEGQNNTAEDVDLTQLEGLLENEVGNL